MVLDADHMRGRRHLPAAAAARTSLPEAEWLALKYKALVERARNLLRVAKILVVTFSLAGEKRMDGVVEIITPHGIQPVSAGLLRAHQLFVVLIALGNHAHLAAQVLRQLLHVLRDLCQDVPR